MTPAEWIAQFLHTPDYGFTRAAIKHWANQERVTKDVPMLVLDALAEAMTKGRSEEVNLESETSSYAIVVYQDHVDVTVDGAKHVFSPNEVSVPLVASVLSADIRRNISLWKNWYGFDKTSDWLEQQEKLFSACTKLNRLVSARMQA